MSAGPHRYTAELRVWGKRLEPEAITREKGLQPCQIRHVGDRIANQTRDEAMWAFDGGTNDWDSLEDGLAFVLDQLGESSRLFAKYGKEHDVAWWCGHFQSSFDGGPSLSARMLERLAAFGVELFIDTFQ